MQVGQLPRPLTTVVRLDPAICANPTRNLLREKIGVVVGGTPLAEDRHTHTIHAVTDENSQEHEHAQMCSALTDSELAVSWRNACLFSGFSLQG